MLLIKELSLLFSLLSNNNDFLINIVLKVWKYSVFLYDLVTFTKFRTILTNESDCFYFFNQFTNDFLKFLILCRRAGRKTFVIKLKTINSIFNNSINQKIFVIIWKLYNRKIRLKISDSIDKDVSLLKLKKIDYDRC